MTTKKSGSDCPRCPLSELKLWLALHAVGYLAIRIERIDLRAAVIDDLAVRWCLSLREGAKQENFDAFFSRYCTEVEQAASKRFIDIFGHEFEYRRVWVSHATCLDRRVKPALA